MHCALRRAQKAKVALEFLSFHEATDTAWDHAKVFDAVLAKAKAKAKGVEIEF